MSANSVSTPRPSTTAADRSRAAAKARPQSPSSSEPKPPKGESIVSKALDGAGLDGAASEARRGTQRIRKAAAEQPTPERAVVATVVEGAKAGINIANAAAGEVAEKVGRAAKPVVDAVVGPTAREGREAAREIGAAGRNVAETSSESRAELTREVSEAWNDQPTIERKVAVAGYEVAENVVQGAGRELGALANAGKEVLEGAGELIVHSPGVNAVRAGAGAAWNGVTALFDRGSRGVEKAGSSVAQTRDSISERSDAQGAENRREIGEAAGDYGRDLVDSLNPFDDEEVSAAWNDQPTIERQLVVAGYEVAENAIQDGFRNSVNAGRVVGEVGEAAAETLVTGVQNAGDALAGGAEAVGGFVSGLFGG